MDLNKIKQMVEDGFAARKIARELGLDFEEVRKLIKTNNYKLANEPFDDSKIAKIKNLYSQGISAKQLGFKFGIDKRRVQKWANEDGILRTLEQSHRLKHVNEHIFDNIDDQFKAYWLGFLYADAYNHEGNASVNLCLKGADIGHIKKYVNFIGGEERDIRIASVTDKESGKEYPTCSYNLYSSHMSQRLKEIGCPQAKSFIITFPEWLEESLQGHFIRGYFDGDGSIKVSKKKEWRVNICGTKEINERIGEIIKNKFNINYKLDYISQTENNTWILVISGNDQIKKFCDWMYQDSATYLDRKYNRYLDLCEQQASRKFLSGTGREFYLINNKDKVNLMEDISSGEFNRKELAKKYKISTKTISEYKKIK